MQNLPSPVSAITSRLAAHIAGAGSSALPEEVAEKTRHHLLDTLAACVSGSRLRAGRAAAGHAAAFAGTGPCTVIGTPFRVSAESAALANGMSAHADETDDSHFGGRFHPGCGIVPAALAVAELRPAGGDAFLRALALGYDVGARFNLSLGPRKLYAGGHSTHSVGPLFGGTAAAAAILSFDERQVRHALSYAVQQASGVQCWSRDTEHVEKAFDFGGMPARGAATAATLVLAGLSAVEDSLSGPNDFYSAFSVQPDREALVEGLGEHFEIMAASIKKWCVGSPIQSAMDAVTEILAAGSIEASAIERIVIRLPDDRCALVDSRLMPSINVQHLVALALVDGTVDFFSSHDEARMADERILALRARTTLVPDPELTLARPPRQSVVAVHLFDGTVRRVHARAVRGTPDDPMTRGEVAKKAGELCRPVLGRERSDALCRAVLSIGEFSDVGAMLRPLLALP